MRSASSQLYSCEPKRAHEHNTRRVADPLTLHMSYRPWSPGTRYPSATGVALRPRGLPRPPPAPARPRSCRGLCYGCFKSKSKSKSKIHIRTRRGGPGHVPSTATGQPLATGTTSTRAPHTRPPRDFQGLDHPALRSSGATPALTTPSQSESGRRPGLCRPWKAMGRTHHK